jgi:hypothetical protein
MDIPYYTIPFTLSAESIAKIKTITDPIVDEFQRTAPLDAGLLHDALGREATAEWFASDHWAEIKRHFEPLGLVPDESCVQIFVYKTRDIKPDARGNPHVDTYDGVDKIVPIRFNILLSGDEDQEMVWWDTAVPWRDDPRIHVDEFPQPKNPAKTFKRAQVNGKTVPDRWKLMGEPAFKYSQLTRYNEFASFVRTDKLHAINWNGAKPRLILSIRFFEPWSAVTALRDQNLK